MANFAFSKLVKNIYVLGFRILDWPLRKTGLLNSFGSKSDPEWKQWLRSLFAIHNFEDMTQLDLPWWTFGAIEAVENHLEKCRDARVFEYGSGSSTIWLARRGAKVTSVEHHTEWAQKVQSALKEFPDITLKAIPEDAQFDSRYPSGKPGYESISFHNYVTSIEQEDGPFDLIIIDGRARSACFKAALPKLAPDGCILLDNSNRARYQSVLQDPDLNIVRYKGLAPGLPYHDETSLVWNEGIQSDED